MKRTNIKTKIVAVILSVITVFSIGSSAVFSTSAASTGNPASDALYEAGLGLLRQYVPGGQAIAGGLDVLLGAFIGGPSLADISNQISELREDMNKQFNELKSDMKYYSAQIENKITDQTIIANKGDSFDQLMNTLQIADRQIDSINADTSINEQEKAVEIAALIGKNADWTNSGNMYNKYMNFLTTLSSSSFGDQKNRDYFQVVYSDMISQSMFSGEALNLSSPYVYRVILLGLYAYSINAECLKAAQTVSKFTAEDEAALSAKELNKYNSICSLTGVINDSIKYMNDRILSTDRSDSVVSHLKAYVETDKNVFVNRGKANKALLADMTVGSLADIADRTDSLLTIMDNGALSHDELKAIASHVRSNHPGTTLRDYLSDVGFNMSSVPQNALFVVGNEERSQSHDSYTPIINSIILKQRDSISIDDSGVGTSARDAYTHTVYSSFLKIINMYEAVCSDNILNFTTA